MKVNDGHYGKASYN